MSTPIIALVANSACGTGTLCMCPPQPLPAGPGSCHSPGGRTCFTYWY